MAEHVEAMPARWNAPANIRALTTLRRGGVSKGAYGSLNLGGQCGDDPGCVAENRLRLRRGLSVPAEPVWLQQAHGTRCIELSGSDEAVEADGSYTEVPGRVCAVLTADCLPLFMCDDAGERVGLFHVGWRGLAAGIVEQAVSIFNRHRDIHCWLGPAIGPGTFEVGPEVREALALPGNGDCFKPSANDSKWMADLYRLVAHRLHRGDIRRVGWDETVCTYTDEHRFFSHRRTPGCGRMASLVWIDEEHRRPGAPIRAAGRQ